MKDSGGTAVRPTEERNKQMHLGEELAAQLRLVCQCVEDYLSMSR